MGGTKAIRCGPMIVKWTYQELRWAQHPALSSCRGGGVGRWDMSICCRAQRRGSSPLSGAAWADL